MSRLHALVLTLIVAANGCGDGRPSRVPVTGQVFIDGQPLTAGKILFHSEKHRPATGKVGPDGRFSLSTYVKGDGCVVGQHHVTVNGSEQVDAMTMQWHAPPRYNSPSNSGLTVEVAEDMEPVTLNLTWDGGQPYKERIGSGEL